MDITRDESLPIHPGTIGSRISIVSDLYASRTEAAAAAGVSAISLRRYIAGEQAPSFEAMAKLALGKGISLEWLATGNGNQGKGDLPSIGCLDTLGNPVDLSEFVFVPRYNIQASAGHGAAILAEEPMFSMAFRRYWIDNYLCIEPSNLAVWSVRGDSMYGVLNDRDVILINLADRHPGSGLYVLRIDGDVIVKRVQRLPGGKLEVKSANNAYSPFEVDLNDPGNDVEVLARVVWFGRQI